ncbi:MAG TPA: 4'-phosphopantetheinyl transferase superfamily protein [Anaeromyxobacteraceae bacterium]|nr:4'-phosphopantetheinyl transferase superfamily protein [Anaeromyxobacteraceae bacterium]
MIPGITLAARFGDSDLWRIELSLPDGDLAGRMECLVERERQRALRLERPDARRRFVAARAGLRHVLARHRRVPPVSVDLVDGINGKPEVRGGPHFSLSHSGELALCAVSSSGRVGVDLERLRPVGEADEMARRWFGDQEREAYRQALRQRPESAFLEVWTRKEAYLKAVGAGLSGLSPRDEVDLDRWEIHPLRPAEGYVGALVQERTATAPAVG